MSQRGGGKKRLGELWAGSTLQARFWSRLLVYLFWSSVLLEEGWHGPGEEVKSCGVASLEDLKGVQGLGFVICPLRTIQWFVFSRICFFPEASQDPF